MTKFKRTGLPFIVVDIQDYIVGCVASALTAAALVSLESHGATIWYTTGGHQKKLLVWREGYETIAAGESYDQVHDMVHRRIDAWSYDI